MSRTRAEYLQRAARPMTPAEIERAARIHRRNRRWTVYQLRVLVGVPDLTANQMAHVKRLVAQGIY